jgi:prevent-host-death family protein
MAQFNVHDAKSNLSRLLDMALEGEEVLISRHGLPVAQLTAIRSANGERILGSGRGSVTILSPDWLAPDWDEPAGKAGA